MRDILVVVFAGLSLLSGCSTTHPDIEKNKDKASELVDEFVAGKSLLECHLACSASWGYARSELLMLYRSERWEQLAKSGLENGHSVDLNYYYLGRAAEGLGLNKAAKTYYLSAVNNGHKCDGFVNNCDGLDVPKLSKARLSNI